MVLTRSQGTMIGIIMVLCVVLFVQWAYYNIGPEHQVATIQGPNPDGSWGEYAEPIVQVIGVMIEFGDEDKAMIFVTINAGNGEKYRGQITIPVYPLTGETETE